MHKEWGTGLDGNSETKLNPALYPIKLTPEMEHVHYREIIEKLGKAQDEDNS
jgi:hypothetical protein